MTQPRVSPPRWGQYGDLGAGRGSLCPIFPVMERHQEMSSNEMNFSDGVFQHTAG